ncbi:MAG: hypothetical protein KF812_10965, partial [Fimbriimonadaceae bacterium]|nr:hypothetical protein [Fimbriimonadaceae bacterium]
MGSQARLVMVVLATMVASVFMTKTVDAQILGTRDTWAVSDFEAKNGVSQAVGTTAAESVFNALENTEKYDLQSLDVIRRYAGDLGYVMPVTDATRLKRLGEASQSSRMVYGEVYAAQVVDVDGGRQGQVAIRVLVLNVASGRIVNGAAVSGMSDKRDASTPDETLLRQAFESASYAAVEAIQARTIPQATVLNIIGEQILINRGSTSGFKVGDRLVLTRGTQLVAEATVTEMDADSAYLRVSRSYSGVRPGDKTESVVDVPIPTGNFNSNGSAQTTRPRSRGGNNNGVITALIVIALGILLFSQGSGGNNPAAANVTAEAMLNTGVTPGVRISWTRDRFFRGNENPFAWQVYREGVQTPVAVVPGQASFAIDDVLGSNSPGPSRPDYDFGGQIGGTECNNGSAPEGSATP